VRTERVARVEGYREEAVQLEADAQQRLARADAALAEARRTGAGERAVARAEAHAREQTLLAEATAAAQRKLADARGRLIAAVQVERQKLESESSQVAAEAARKILGREVTT
jgi:F0F1-type ATP synthase membrane subunit b/b'